MNLTVKNVTIIDGEQKIGDIYITNGIISSLPPEGGEVIDGTGLYAAPGLVDMHVHLREPGQVHKEEIATGTMAAAAGGVTTVLAMPNTAPATDCKAVVEFIKSRPATVKVEVCGAVTKGLKGEDFADYEGMKKAGIIAISDDGRPIEHHTNMIHALKEAARLGLTLCDHCEELSIDGDMASSESISVARDISLAEELGLAVHICHVSTKDSVRIIRDAKAAGVKVTAETAPHYFTLTKEDVKGDTNAKMNPPLRTADDRAAIIEGLKDGTLDVIVTDHAPHSAEEKAVEFKKAPNGITGLETSLALGITELVGKGHFTLPQLIEKMSTAPAKLLGLNRGSLEVGYEGDIVLFDPNEEFSVTAEGMKSRSKNSPFIGKTLKGKVKYTIVNGEVVYVDR